MAPNGGALTGPKDRPRCSTSHLVFSCGWKSSQAAAGDGRSSASDDQLQTALAPTWKINDSGQNGEWYKQASRV